ncbi:MAG: TetR/AcrR family transcriptional regulator [Methylotetracoccus sp.]|nr:TetR/AcrR family transcriptional regulator [Methylotetracoccus sp.]
MARAAAKKLTREKLLDEGVAMLIDQGYHGTGLQDVLQAVGIPKGSFYNYFDSKEQFAAAVIQHYIEPFIQQLDGYLQQSELSGSAALESYYWAQIEESARRQFRGGCLLGNLIGEIGETSETCRNAIRSALGRYRNKIMEAIEKGQREGAFRRDKTALEMADLLVNAWQGALLRMKIEQSVHPLEECCRNLLGDYFKN